MVSQEIKTSLNIIQKKGIFGLLNAVLAYIFQLLLMPYYWIRLKFISFDNPDSIINFAYKSKFGVLRPAQVKSEILSLINIVSKERPKRVLEIGTAKGGTLFTITKASADDAKIISLDYRGGSFGGGYPLWRIPLLKAYASKNQEMILVKGDSHKKETLEKIKKILNGDKLDFLFIDGDHTYEGVKSDFLMYNFLVRKGGFIAFHDITKHSQDQTCKVNEFWKEIKVKYKYDELIESKEQGWAGIGVIYL